MGTSFILSLDLGTTGNRSFCLDEKGKVISSSYREFTQHFPKQGWVEHDPEEIWQSVSRLIPETLEKGNLEGKDCLGIGITNQRETAVIWDRNTGKPIHNAIVWQCRRTADICHRLKKEGHEDTFRTKTGLLIDAYFSGTKITWLLQNVKGAREAANEGKLAFGTIDSWIIWKLTGGKNHVTDMTNASRTLLFNIHDFKWDSELQNILEVPGSLLPEVQPPASVFGETSGVPGLPDGTLIGGVAGDQQAAMVGQNCVTPGTSKNTYGTGCFVLLHNGGDSVISKHGLLTTIVSDPKGEPAYAFEGSVFVAGAVIQWLRDYMNFFEESSVSEEMALSADGDDGVVFIPAFVGLGAPHWNMDVRGAIFGLTRSTTREQITRAALKSIAHQSMDVMIAMEEDSGKKIEELRVDGGATANRYLLQYQSDILNIPVLVPENPETTALGSAYLAGISAGLYKTIDEIASFNTISEQYKPSMDNSLRERERKHWKDAINTLLGNKQ